MGEQWAVSIEHQQSTLTMKRMENVIVIVAVSYIAHRQSGCQMNEFLLLQLLLFDCFRFWTGGFCPQLKRAASNSIKPFYS